MSDQSDDISLLAAALCELQHEIVGARKDSKNPFFKSSYADLESCVDALRDSLYKHGFAVNHTGGVVDGKPGLFTTLMHKSGQWMRGWMPLSAKAENDPQAQGSAVTYARRYGLCAITGLIQIDDDAEAAMNRQPAPPKMIASKPAIPKTIDQLWFELKVETRKRGFKDKEVADFKLALEKEGLPPKEIYLKTKTHFMEKPHVSDPETGDNPDYSDPYFTAG